MAQQESLSYQEKAVIKLLAQQWKALKGKFFHEFKAHQLVGQTHQRHQRFFYLHQKSPSMRQLIVRELFDTQVLDEGENIGKPFHATGTHSPFHAIAYNHGELSTLIKVWD